MSGEFAKGCRDGLVAAVAGMLLIPSVASRLQTPRPQEPEPPLPYMTLEVTYENESDGTHLAGTLTVPEGEGPFPAALLVSGAGPQDRDYSVFGHRPFLVLADHLSRRGIAVLRVDDRGAAGSGGDAAQASVADVVSDLRAGIERLRAEAGIDPSATGLIAHSEGGRVAPIAAAEIEEVAFVVLLAPPAISSSELATAQAEAAMEVAADPMIPVQAALVARIREILRDVPDAGSAISLLYEEWDTWAGSQPETVSRVLDAMRAQEALRPQLTQLAAALATPWNRELHGLDPGPPLRALEVPTLALYGDRDRQAPPGPNVAALEAEWSGKPDASIEILPGLNHFFQHAETGLAAEIPGIDETLAPEVLERVAEWVLRQSVGTAR